MPELVFPSNPVAEPVVLSPHYTLSQITCFNFKNKRCWRAFFKQSLPGIIEVGHECLCTATNFFWWHDWAIQTNYMSNELDNRYPWKIDWNHPHRMRTIMRRGLYNFYPVFHCGLYSKAANITNNLCTKYANSSKKKSGVYNQEQFQIKRGW